MERARVVCYVAQVLASASAGALARSIPRHRPITGLLLGGLLCDLGLLSGALPFRLEVALGTVYPWAVLGVDLVVLDPFNLNKGRQKLNRTTVHRGDLRSSCSFNLNVRPTRLNTALCAAYLGYLAGLLGLGLRGAALSWAYAVAQAGLAIALIVIVARWRSTRSRGRRPTVTEACAVICAAAEIANAAGPYLHLPQTWALGRVTYVCCFLALTAVQGAGTWTTLFEQDLRGC